MLALHHFVAKADELTYLQLGLAFIERRTAELNKEAAARFATLADAEDVDFGEFLEKVLDAYERAKER
jgi:hypothetical protein